MKQDAKKLFGLGIMWITIFVVWTVLIRVVDVQPVGQNGTNIGFATFNCWFHNLTGVHMEIYVITDWFGLVPIFVCLLFAVLGLLQFIKRRSFFRYPLMTYYQVKNYFQ